MAMTTLYLLRHAESEANARHLLAGQKDYALTNTGKADAQSLALDFAARFAIDAIWCSPLLRAQQTAAPFLTACNVPIKIDKRLLEQDMGRFSGMSYAEAEGDPGYRADRSARWDWQPDGGGESYRQIAVRVAAWLEDIRNQYASHEHARLLVVTHAVTLRLFRACLENTLPRYPEKIAGNGELWIAPLPAPGQASVIESVPLGNGPRAHRA